MKGSVVLFLVMCICWVACLFLLWILLRRLKKTKEELQESKAKLLIKDTELEVIRDVQDSIKESKNKEAPEEVKAPVPGDSASRLDRLNKLSNNSKN